MTLAPMRRVLVLALALIMLAACGESTEQAPAAAPPPKPEVSAWERFIDAQIEAHLQAHPAWAVMPGPARV